MNGEKLEIFAKVTPELIAQMRAEGKELYQVLANDKVHYVFK